MSLVFVTGSNAAFFNSLLIGLQSFAERLPDQRLLVCDYGLTAPQAAFLQRKGMLLARPPSITPPLDAFRCKAALLRYLQHGGYTVGDDGQGGENTIVWLDGDLTLMATGLADFTAITAIMQSAGTDVAACTEISGHNLGQMIASFTDQESIAPFAEVVAAAGLDPALPYFSSGLFFCRSAAFLERWDKRTRATPTHPLFEQNMFNVGVYQDAGTVTALDCETWQAQGASLDHVELNWDGGGRPTAWIGPKPVKTLHTTSSGRGHLLIVEGRLAVEDVALSGPFKLFFAEPLRMLQLSLLASFVHGHRDIFLSMGIGERLADPIEGFQFTSPL